MVVGETFDAAFIGLKVEIVADFYQHYTEQTEVSMTNSSAPASIRGYILDADQLFYYIGKTPNEVTMAVKRDIVLYIEVLEDKTEYDEILESMPIPGSKNEEN